MTEKTRDLAGARRLFNTLWWAAWICMAACLVAIGFLLDPVTAIGHHLFLIGGGTLLGIKLGRKLS